MHLSFQHNYSGTPQQVVDLFRNPDFISDVARHSGASSHEVHQEGDDIRLDMVLEAPPEAARFTGRDVNLSMTFRWDDAASGDGRTGDVDVNVKGLPVAVDARCVLAPTTQGCRADYAGDLKVRIPLVGGKVERMVAPFITDAFSGIERRAQHWLTQA